ncbi:MAG: hypothetical protein IJ651_01940 [Bacteroidales bacterium]|nr:hypothetical protein [Bacteroidales bacterium]
MLNKLAQICFCCVLLLTGYTGFAPRWEAFTDIGFFGARYADAYGWYPLLGFNPQSAVVGITYRFR